MNEGRLIFTQISDLIHREQFDRCMKLHPMPRASRGMTARDQFLAMLFAQLTFRESLRDITACLYGSPHLYGMGIRGNITRWDCLRRGRLDNRPLPFGVPVGEIQKDESGDKTSHPNRPNGLNPCIYKPFRRFRA